MLNNIIYLFYMLCKNRSLSLNHIYIKFLELKFRIKSNYFNTEKIIDFI